MKATLTYSRSMTRAEMVAWFAERKREIVRCAECNHEAELHSRSHRGWEEINGKEYCPLCFVEAWARECNE